MAYRRSDTRRRENFIALLLVAVITLCCLAVSFPDKASEILGVQVPGWDEVFAAVGLDASTPVTVPDAPMSVHFIDVGQADCTLVLVDGATLLIDAGEVDSGDTIVAYLRALGVERLDYLIGTHPHADHIGSMWEIIDTFDIGTLILPDVPEEITPTTTTYERMLEAIEEKGIEITPAVPSDTYAVGDAVMTILAPLDDYGDLNSESVVCRLAYGSISFLFAGDAGTDSEEDILADGANIDSTVLKVGHHGSKTSTSRAFLEAVSPEYCVIHCGAGNSYGLPDEEILDRIAESGAALYRTDLDGTVVFTVEDGELHVTTEK